MPIKCTPENPCGKASRGYLQPGECPRCHIRINQDQLLKLVQEAKVELSLPPNAPAPCKFIGKLQKPPEGADVRRQYYLCEAGLGVVSACKCGPSKCTQYKSEGE